MPVMDPKLFSKRRADVMQHMGGGVAILPTAPVRHAQPRRALSLPRGQRFLLPHAFPRTRGGGGAGARRAHGEYILFCRERNPEKEIWEGRRAGLEGARELYGADDAFPIEDIDEILPGLLENREKVFYSMGRYPDFDTHLMNWVNEVRGKARNGVQRPASMWTCNTSCTRCAWSSARKRSSS